MVGILGVGMTGVQVTSKGQITILIGLRKKYDIDEGGRVEVVEEDGRIVVRRAASFYDLAGVDAGKATVEEMKRMLDGLREGARALSMNCRSMIIIIWILIRNPCFRGLGSAPQKPPLL